MDPANLSMMISVLLLFLLLFMGVNIGASLCLSGITGTFLFLGSWEPAFSVLLLQVFDVATSYPMMVIPLFVLMGAIASECGMTGDVFTLFYRLLGRVRGGVAIATVFTSAGMASISGSSVAVSSAMTRIALPELRRFDYNERLSVGAIASGGTLAIIIPPSIALVLFAIFAQQSVGKMLLAGIVPGLIIAVGYVIKIYLRCVIDPKLAPLGPKFTAKEKLEALPGVLPFFAVILAVILGILFGIWTPVESAAVAVILVAIIAFIRGRMTWSAFLIAAKNSVLISTSIFFVVIGSMVFGNYLALSGFSENIVNWISAYSLSSLQLFIAIIIVYMVLGMFMEGASILALTVPLVMPLVASAGWNPIWFGVVLVVLIEVAAVTPPVGLNLYAVKASSPGTSIGSIIVGCMPFWLINLGAICLFYFVPWFVLVLPNLQ